MLRPGPHREGEEPKPMMHERGKSDSAVRAVKPANKAERSAAELVGQRAGTKGNADQQSTRGAQERESVSQALGRIRQAAKQRKKEKFTTLFHHISVECRPWSGRSSTGGGWCGRTCGRIGGRLLAKTDARSRTLNIRMPERPRPRNPAARAGDLTS